jgi:hypothetical protein
MEQPHDPSTLALYDQSEKETDGGLGLPGTTADYEEDHLIPFEACGRPKHEVSLWPQKWSLPEKHQRPGSSHKDLIENYIHDEICFTVPNHKTLQTGPPRERFHQPAARTGDSRLGLDRCYLKYLSKPPCQ